MKLKNKLIAILLGILFFTLVLEFFLGDIYFEKYFRYSKVRELSNINFIQGDILDMKLLKEYQKNNKAFVIVMERDKIININNFNYLTIENNEKEEVILLDAFLDNLYSIEKFNLEKDDKVKIKAIKVLNQYYIPIEIIKDDQKFKDYKFNYLKENVIDLKGVITKLSQSNEKSSQSDDFLEMLLEIDINKVQNRDYMDSNNEDEFRIITKNINEFKVIIFYSYETINDIFPTMKSFFYLKGLLIILMVFLVGKILDNEIIKPITTLSRITKNIGNLNFNEKIIYNKNDEIGNLYKTLFKMNDNLKEVIQLYKDELKNNRNSQVVLEERIKLFMHEIKTPLSAIIGFSDILLCEKNSEELGIINSEGKRLLTLANNLINKENKNEKIILIKSKFNINYEIETALKIYEKELKNIRIDFINQKDIWVRGDREKLKQVILNILGNSVEFAKQNIRINFDKKMDLIILSIENDGPQISDDTITKIWSKFYSTNGEGRGLGLFISSEILKAHKFGFSVENTKIGVKFNIYITKGE
ncbi:HAMP domain-containing histidine kinase [Cetobacterium sp. 2A]|uniref:sensor histidine kinase n=1 Tax=Cetobacterium sp. 2A TaxID=2754723 RepID=UPI00163C8F48|nr:HAMP domain-containing sensor histidine kinase [Cetobacterium sp. 2A]MBC2856996.1 HAMP domain-containing histidine kinase [Cetobacterium sp. 2A]